MVVVKKKRFSIFTTRVHYETTSNVIVMIALSRFFWFRV